MPNPTKDKKHKQSKTAPTAHPTGTDTVALIICIGGKWQDQIPFEEVDADLIEQIRAKILESTEAAVIDITDISRWPDSQRWLLLQLIKVLGTRLVAKVAAQTWPDPFKAVLNAMVGSDDLRAHARSIEAAKEAAAVFYPEVINAAVGLINRRLVELGEPRLAAGSLAKGNQGACGQRRR